MRDRRSQVSQIFTYIFTGIVVVAVLWFGTQAYANLVKGADYVECIMFKENIAKRLDHATKYGVYETIKLKSACDADYVCFKGQGILGTGPQDVNIKQTDYPIIYDIVQSGSGYNVFFLDQNIVTDAIKVERLDVVRDLSPTPGAAEIDGFFCTSIGSGSLKIEAEGVGKRVMISPVTASP